MQRRPPFLSAFRLPPFRPWILPGILAAAALAPAQSGSYLNPRPGTIALWHLDEGKGLAPKDRGPFSFQARLFSGARWISSPWGKAVLADPKAGAFQVTDSRNILRLSYPFTLEAWVRLDDLRVPVQPILSRKGPGGSSAFELRFMTFPAGLAFKVMDSHGTPQVLFGRMTVKPGSWHHAAVTWDGKEARVYGDGRLLSRLPLSPFLSPDLRRPLLAGAGENGTFLKGALDEMHIAAGALAPSSFRSGWTNYGRGKPGSGGAVPRLTLLGGPPATQAGNLSLLVERGMPNMPGLLFLSPRPAALPFGGGLLLVSPAGMIPTLIQLDGGLAGIPGTAQANLPLPPPGPSALGRPLFFQVLLVDPKAPGLFSMSPGAAVWFPY